MGESRLGMSSCRRKVNAHDLPVLQFYQIDSVWFNLPTSDAPWVQCWVLRPAEMGLTRSLPSVMFLALRDTEMSNESRRGAYHGEVERA